MSDHVFFEGIERPVRRRTGTKARLRRAVMSTAAPPVEAGRFLAALMERAELPLAHYRPRSLARRLPACLRWLRVGNLAEAQRRLETEPAIAAGALGVVLLGVTEFFRDAAVFEQLGTEILPRLSARPGPLRVWSAACSEGHELYSVAMLLAEADRLGACELLGTDCRAEAIERARSGGFASEAVAGLEPRWRDGYFSVRGFRAVIDPALSGATRWKTANLLAEIEPGPWSLILWRNMSIYLETTAAEAIWQRLCNELEPGGYLMAGKADHPPASVPLRRVGSCLYQKAGGLS